MQPFGHKGRLEDERMLKGSGRYVADWNLPGQACGHFLRSDRAHAEIAAAGQDAAEAVAVEYRELPAVIDARAALARGAPLLHENVPGNLLLDFAGGDEAATEAAFRRAVRVVRLTSYHSRVVGNPMEPRAGMGVFDSDSGIFQLYAW